MMGHNQVTEHPLLSDAPENSSKTAGACIGVRNQQSSGLS